MKCPVCSNSLRKARTKTAIVDVCLNCRGIWFDPGKFAVFVNALANSEKITPDKIKLFERRDVHAIFNWGSDVPAIGASGFISGIMGAYLIFYPTANVTLWCPYRTIELPVFVYFTVWLVLQIVSSSLGGDEIGANVAWFAHIGGFLFGAAVAFFKKIRSQN